ncbi:putative membrane protein YteJ [Tenuifilaceae bacterium CYCD]|nr:putative membrane protein YteJ [Tenuifilaceae bacterium CYCD]
MEKKYAGFWWRFIAHLLDGAILGVVQFILLLPFIGSIIYTAVKASNGDLSDIQALGVAGTIVGTIFLFAMLSVAAGWLYFALMESSKYQGTIGKIVLGIIVTDDMGGRISFGRATGRYFSKIISGMIFWIGYIMAGFTDKKQALHDVIANTLVWKKP